MPQIQKKFKIVALKRNKNMKIDGSGVQVREKLANTSTAIIFLTVVDDENQILEKIGDIGDNFVEDNTLTVYVKRLREKLGSFSHKFCNEI